MNRLKNLIGATTIAFGLNACNPDVNPTSTVPGSSVITTISPELMDAIKTQSKTYLVDEKKVTEFVLNEQKAGKNVTSTDIACYCRNNLIESLEVSE